MGAAACCVSYSFTEDPEGRSCSLGSKPSWPMFAASASVYSIQQTLLYSLLVPGYVPGACIPCPGGAPRLVGKWAGGPVQGWGGQAQIQGWLCWGRGLLIPAPAQSNTSLAGQRAI